MAALYRIRKWSEHYENNRSRKITDLRWVAIPNRHDGETFSLIMAHPDGSMIFSAWILMVQIASKCVPRGTLIRGNGIPHNVTSMSAKCRAPDVWFKKAIEYLISNTDWLECEDVTPKRHPNVSLTSPERQSGDEEGRDRRNGMEGIEGSENVTNGTIPEIPLSLMLKERLADFYHRDTEERWNYNDEHTLSEVCKRKNPLGELTEISAYRKKLPAKEQKFFPASAGALLSKWDDVVDRARNYREPSAF